MEPKDKQLKHAQENQSPHDPYKLEPCPDCGVPSVKAVNAISRNPKPVRFHWVSRGNGFYGYEPSKHN